MNDIDFTIYNDRDLIDLAKDTKQLAGFDHETKCYLLEELAHRLEQYVNH